MYNIKKFRSGYVALLGRPNVGKSTFLNNLTGIKLAAVTPKPQTTRDRISGVVSTKEYQIVLVDTPGMHRSKETLNRYMNKQSAGAAGDADVIIYMIEVMAKFSKFKHELKLLTEMIHDENKPSILIINKIDLFAKEKLLPLIKEIDDNYSFPHIFPISALKETDFKQILDIVASYLPISPPYFPDDQVTDKDLRFLASEMIREKLMLKLRNEIPYSTAVTIENWEYDEKGIAHIDAAIHVERKSQKGIVIGKGGQLLKDIGTLARKEIELLADSKVMLSLFVRIEKDWTSDPGKLKKLGYK